MTEAINLNIESLYKIEDETLSFHEELQILIDSIYNWDGPANSTDQFFEGIKKYIRRDLHLTKKEALNILNDENFQLSLWKHESFFLLTNLYKSDSEFLDERIKKLLAKITRYLNK